MAGAKTPNCTDQSTLTATTVVATNNGRPNPPSKSTMRRFVGVRQRPSGRWVAEIKDSSQRVRLWLGTYDTPEAAARAYDEAARALRGENARTNFAQVNSITDQQSPVRTPSHLGSGSASDGRLGLSFSSLKAKLSKNLQNIMARARDGKSSKSRVSDHFAFASIFHRGSFQYQTPHDVDMKNMEKVVQPSIIVPPVESEACSWENSSISDCSSEWLGFRQGGLDSDGSDVGEVGFVDQLMGWIDSPDICPSEGSRSKRFKVSSSVMVPPTFSGSPYDGCCSPYSGSDSPYHGYGSPYNYREHH